MYVLSYPEIYLNDLPITIDIEPLRQKYGTILENRLSQTDYACFLISYVKNLCL